MMWLTLRSALRLLRSVSGPLQPRQWRVRKEMGPASTFTIYSQPLSAGWPTVPWGSNRHKLHPKAYPEINITT